MSKFTTARVERWERDVTKAMQLLERTEADQRSAYQTTKGGRLQDVGACLQATRAARGTAQTSLAAIADLRTGEQRRKT